MNAFGAMIHNGNLIRRAESIINGFLNSETENHKVGLYLVNPDGTRIAIQPGFKLEDYEIVVATTDKNGEEM